MGGGFRESGLVKQHAQRHGCLRRVSVLRHGQIAFADSVIVRAAGDAKNQIRQKPQQKPGLVASQQNVIGARFHRRSIIDTRRAARQEKKKVRRYSGVLLSFAGSAISHNGAGVFSLVRNKRERSKL